MASVSATTNNNACFEPTGDQYRYVIAKFVDRRYEVRTASEWTSTS
jgi:hypothetical protein